MRTPRQASATAGRPAILAADAARAHGGTRFKIFPQPPFLKAFAQPVTVTLSPPVGTVRPALEKFYQLLTDEQKARFNSLGGEESQQQAPEEHVERQRETREAVDDETRARDVHDQARHELALV